MTARYTVADHLVDRLEQLGVDRVFGVPGDYSLRMLDHITHHRTVRWTGCTNELNAGYAADGYARLRGFAAVCTTFGVGELSAINAIAGSYAEHVPVLHIVGAPALAQQAEHRPLHHTLGDDDYGHFLTAHAAITCARAALTPDNATTEIDRVLTEMRDRCRPGYLLIPADVATAPATVARGPLPEPVDTTDPEVLQGFVDAARQVLTRAGSTDQVTVLAGLLVHRLGATDTLTKLLAGRPVPHATTLWSKGLVDEAAPAFIGVYADVADERIRRSVEDADVLILAGVQFTDRDDGLSTRVGRPGTIGLGARSATVGATTYAPLELPTALAALGPLLSELEAGLSVTPAPPASRPAADDADPLSQQVLWSEVADILRSDDIVLAEVGTAFFGMAPQRLPWGVTFLSQPLWCSIGYTLPALLGACLARPGRRGVLLVGDGAAQVTVQELSTVLRLDLPAIVLVVDNDGYTIERAIHAPGEPYHDIDHWNWTLLPTVFDGGGRASAVQVHTVGELRAALADAPADGFTLIQATVPHNDVPDLLDALTR